MLWAASVVALAAASLAGKHHDAVRRRLSETPDGRALNIAGPVVASIGNQVATVDSLQNYELTFTMELASDWSITGDWQSVFHIGDMNSHRLPGIWFHQSQNALWVKQTYSDCYPSHCEWGGMTTGVTFAAGETYDIKVVVQNYQMAVYVDGGLAGTESGSSTYAATDANVYVGDPWYNAAKVTLSDIRLSELTAPGMFTFLAGRCYPQSEASYINSGGIISSGTPKECHNQCEEHGSNVIGVELDFDTIFSPSGHRCICKNPRGQTSDSRLVDPRKSDQRSTRAQANTPRTTTTLVVLVRDPPARRWRPET